MIATWMLLGALVLQESESSHLGSSFLESCVASGKDADRNATRVNDPRAFAEMRVKDTSCDEYINGLADGLEMGGLVCFPNGGTPAQRSLTYLLKREHVVKYLRDHPELLRLGRNRLVTDALVKAFPCKKQ